MIIKQYVRFSKKSLNSGPIKHYQEDNTLVEKNKSGIFTIFYYDNPVNNIVKRLAIIPGMIAFLSRLSFYKFLRNELSTNCGKIILLRVSSFDVMLLPVLVRFYSRKIKVIIVYHSIFDEKFLTISKFYHKVCSKYCFGIAAPTQEILDFYNPNPSSGCKNFLLPNGVHIDHKVRLKGNIYSGKVLNIVFVASSNQKWHSLEAIIKVIRDNNDTEVKLHIIGNIDGKKEKNIIFWGRKEGEELYSLLADMDIGLGSFPEQDFILKETSALKNREYLRHGIPVYTGLYDTLADNKSRFFRVGELDIIKIIEFANEVKGFSKTKIQAAYKEDIDRERIIENFVDNVVKYQ